MARLAILAVLGALSMSGVALAQSSGGNSPTTDSGTRNPPAVNPPPTHGGPASQSITPAPGATTSGTNMPVGQVLSEDEIREKLKQEGYTEITELRQQGPSYEAKAMKDGRNVNLTVDARTGSVRSAY